MARGLARTRMNFAPKRRLRACAGAVSSPLVDQGATERRAVALQPTVQNTVLKEPNGVYKFSREFGWDDGPRRTTYEVLAVNSSIAVNLSRLLLYVLRVVSMAELPCLHCAAVSPRSR